VGLALETSANVPMLGWALGERRLLARQVIRLIPKREAPIPSWWALVINRLEELSAATDIGTERPLHIEDVVDALKFLDRVMGEDTRPPWIGRLSSGGIELAWKHANVEVEAVFDRLRDDRELLVSVGENEWDAPIDRGDSLFANVVDRLSSSYIEHTPETSSRAARTQLSS
jgi:hypothetical protein